MIEFAALVAEYLASRDSDSGGDLCLNELRRL